MSDNPFPRLQATATILTPVLLGIGGLILSLQAQNTSDRIQAISQTVSAVTAMEPYIDRLADGSPEKATMAAYALYKLNPTDKKAAIYMILAANRQETTKVVEQLGKDDPEVKSIVEGVIQDIDAAQRAAVDPASENPAELPVADQTPLASAAVKVSRAYTVEGWMYLGTFAGQWERKQLEIGDSLPKEHQLYSVLDDTYLRVDRPSLPLYRLPAATGVVKAGDKVRIVEIEPDVGNNRVWARVRVTSPTPE